MISDNPRETIEDIVEESTKYLRGYTGTVLFNQDPLDPKSGIIWCKVPDLGKTSALDALRCRPQQTNSLTIPAIGDLVDIRFNSVDMDDAVYLGKNVENKLAQPFSFNGLATTQVVHESPILKQSIVVDDLLGSISLSPLLGVEIGLATEPMVLGNSLVTFLTQMSVEINALVTAFNNHVHPTTAPGAPTGLPGLFPTGLPPVTVAPVTPPTPLTFNSLFNKLD